MNGYVLAVVAVFGIILALPVIGGRRMSLRRHWLSGSIDSEGDRVVEVIVRGGFHPATIRVRQGERVQLLFRRVEDDPCTARVYLTQPRIDRVLPAFATTTLTFVAAMPGRHLFTCEEGRHHGHLLVDPADSTTTGSSRDPRAGMR